VTWRSFSQGHCGAANWFIPHCIRPNPTTPCTP